MASYTLSQLQADFDSGSAHISDSASPYLEFHFGSGPTGNIFKSTMVKKGGAKVAWQQPVLLTGATGSLLKVVAKSHKSLGTDKTIGYGTVDLGASAHANGATVIPLTSEKGKSAGVIRFNVSSGAASGIAQPQANNGIVDGVGGVGHNVHEGIAPTNTAVTGGVVTAPGGGAGGFGGPGGAGGAPLHGSQGSGFGAGQGGPGFGAGQGQGGPGFGAGGVGSAPGQGAVVPAGGQQLAPTGQHGLQPGGAGGVGGFGGQGQGIQGQGVGSGFGANAGPTEHHEKRSHNVSDHQENETYETSSRRY